MHSSMFRCKIALHELEDEPLYSWSDNIEVYKEDFIELITNRRFYY